MTGRLRRACAVIGAGSIVLAGVLAAGAGPAGAATGGPGGGRTLRSALRHDLNQYLARRRKVEHISAVSLRVTFRARRSVNLAVGTTRYRGGRRVSPTALWQVGSNTKAFTSVIMLQLEAEGRLSINNTLGKWLPQYPQWRHITIRQLLNMTSGIPNYAAQPAFLDAIAANPARVFSARKLVSYAYGLPLLSGWNYSNTGYILAQMIIEKVTHHSFADQLTRRIIDPLKLRALCYAPYTCPRGTAARMPSGYGVGYPPPLEKLNGTPVPKLGLTWAQASGAIISSTADLTTWERALYRGHELPPRQQRQLESLVSEVTGKPIRHATPGNTGFGLGMEQDTSAVTGRVWSYAGGTFGYRVLHVYQPASGVIVLLALNSAPGRSSNNHISSLLVSIFKTLQAYGLAHSAALTRS